MKKHQIEIAEPCHASWDAMHGDDQRRFCNSCQKHVHNLSAMPRVRALALLQQRDTEGGLCVRYGSDRDGNVRFSARRVSATAPEPQRAGARELLARAGAVAGAVLALTQRDAHASDDPVFMGEMEAIDLPVDGSSEGSGADVVEQKPTEPCDTPTEMGQVPAVQPPVPMIQGGLPPMQFSPSGPKATKSIAATLELQELHAASVLADVGISVEETEIVDQTVVAQVAVDQAVGQSLDESAEGSGAAEGSVDVADAIAEPIKVDDATYAPVLMGRMIPPEHR